MRFLLLSLLLLPTAVVAATMRTAYVSPAGTAREAPRDARKPAPLPAPAPTNHYAGTVKLPPAWKL